MKVMQGFSGQSQELVSEHLIAMNKLPYLVYIQIL